LNRNGTAFSYYLEEALKNEAPFKPSGFFLLRTPLLPFDDFVAWGRDLETPTAADDDLNQKHAADVKRLRARLDKILSDPVMRDALFIASPNIIERFHLWTEDPTSERGRKIEHVLVRYFSRMTARPTPFGLFAGCSVGKIAGETRLIIDDRSKYRRHSRLDMDYLFALTEALQRDEVLKQNLKYWPNSSLYRTAGRLRYVESRLNDKIRSYHLVDVEATDYLDSTLKLAEKGATFKDLAHALVNDEIEAADAEEYIADLIESQILVPAPFLGATGTEPIHPLISQLQTNAKTSTVAIALDKVRDELCRIDESGPGASPERYYTVSKVLEDLPAKVELARLIQVDMFKPASDATLGGRVLTEIARGVEMFRGLARRPHESMLSRFRSEFIERYEHREIPLVEALDDEIGIGFGGGEEASPLLKDLMFPLLMDRAEIEPGPESILLRKIGDAVRKGDREIELDDHDLEGLNIKKPLHLPDSFYVDAIIAGVSNSALNRGEFRVFLRSCAGPSGAIMLGRFCHADQELHSRVQELVRAEESLRPDSTFAEIVHLPEGRVGNIIIRPVLREYEIPYLGGSAVAEDKQIPITDLYVSVDGENIKLRSARLGCTVLPRLTSAHNYLGSSLSIYRFLAAIQHQNLAVGVTWDWGSLRRALFLPRVRSGRIVFSLARWRIPKEEIDRLNAKKDAERFQRVQEWRQERQLPRYFSLVDGDNLLLTDLDNALSIDSFIQSIKDREEAVLQEMFPGPDDLCAVGPEGRFVHELIIPFTGNGDVAVKLNEERSIPITADRVSFRRSFPPGSEWIYLKLYTGATTADRILRERVKQLTEKVLQSRGADKWFFIRYGDPRWHVRLRFHGRHQKLNSDVLSAIHETFNPLLDDGLLWRIQFDTYEREVERYGGPEGVVLSEEFFHLDSEAVLEILDMLEPGDKGADERWRLTLYGIDRLLADFNFDLKNRYEILKEVRGAIGEEFSVDKPLGIQLAEKFRKERSNIAALLDPANVENHELAPGFAVFGNRSSRLLPLVNLFGECEQRNGLSLAVRELLPSFIHMFANRLLRSAQRKHELVIYDLLFRHYESALKRS
jgi:thiopeptide-type bacteriocin biosynthesis protein